LVQVLEWWFEVLDKFNPVPEEKNKEKQENEKESLKSGLRTES